MWSTLLWLGVDACITTSNDPTWGGVPVNVNEVESQRQRGAATKDRYERNYYTRVNCSCM